MYGLGIGNLGVFDIDGVSGNGEPFVFIDVYTTDGYVETMIALLSEDLANGAKITIEIPNVVHKIDPKYLPEEWKQLMADVADLKERVSALESGNAGGGSGGNTTGQMIVPFNRGGEYPEYSINEYNYAQISNNVPTYDQFRQSAMSIRFEGWETDEKFVFTNTYDTANSPTWMATYRDEYGESSYNNYWVAVVPNEWAGIPKGVYVAFDFIESDYGYLHESVVTVDTGEIIFPEVTA